MRKKGRKRKREKRTLGSPYKTILNRHKKGKVGKLGKTSRIHKAGDSGHRLKGVTPKDGEIYLSEQARSGAAE